MLLLLKKDVWHFFRHFKSYCTVLTDLLKYLLKIIKIDIPFLKSNVRNVFEHLLRTFQCSGVLLSNMKILGSRIPKILAKMLDEIFDSDQNSWSNTMFFLIFEIFNFYSNFEVIQISPTFHLTSQKYHAGWNLGSQKYHPGWNLRLMYPALKIQWIEPRHQGLINYLTLTSNFNLHFCTLICASFCCKLHLCNILS